MYLDQEKQYSVYLRIGDKVPKLYIECRVHVTNTNLPAKCRETGDSEINR